VDNLDYEVKRDYKLTVRATDGVSGVFAEVMVSVTVTDVNDCPPEFLTDTYNVSVSEAAPFGTSILRVTARDNDTGMLVSRIFQLSVNTLTDTNFDIGAPFLPSRVMIGQVYDFSRFSCLRLL